MTTRRNSSLKFTLPDVIDPPGRLCFQIEVPNERAHIAAFRGALLILASALNWQDDEDHTAKDVAKVWDRIYQNVRVCVPCIDEMAGAVFLEDAMIPFRINPDNNCQWQIWCIDHWELFWDASDCVAGSATNPGPAGELAPGECKNFDLVCPGNSRVLLPVPIDDGYTIRVISTDGGWWNGNVLDAWSCPNGAMFAGGICGPDGALHVTDPIPDLSYGTLIADIDGVFYKAAESTIVVPPGTGAQDVYLQMNDNDLSDNQGSISMRIQICAPVGDIWCHEWLGGAGIGALIADTGSFAAGGTQVQSASLAGNAEQACAQINMVGTITDISMVVGYNHTGAAGTAGCGFAHDAGGCTSFDLLLVYTPVGSGDLTVHWTGSQAITSNVKFFGSSINAAHTHTYIKSIIVHGTGTNPFASSNCT